jgi:hypothetical protein
MNEAHLNQLIAAANQKRVENVARRKRRIEMGYENGKILPNGVAVITSPSGIQHWYDTRTLVKLVTEAFDRNEKVSGRRVCHINGKWRLQIRGKHLRRLLKAMPNVKQIGRMLVEEK